ncbi:hypothetical protein VTO73DRAFT_7421 [Trametes versicolor]
MVDTPQHPVAYATAPHPFDLESADMIIRTPDRVDFRVHKAILAITSPVFDTMFQLPQPSHPASASSIPVVDVSEDSKTLDTLLRLCYPVPKNEVANVDAIVPALVAAMKYDMEWAVSTLSEQVEEAAFQEPLRTWAIACRIGSETIALTAASFLLKGKDVSARNLPFIVEMEGATALDGASAGDYFRLDEFLRKKGKVGSDFRMLSTLDPFTGRAAAPPCDDAHVEFSLTIPLPDVICRSSDGVDFKAHRAILSLNSIVFRQTPPVAEHPDLHMLRSPVPVLQFDGDAQTLSAVLRICYGAALSSLPHLARVIAVCGKYNMETLQRITECMWDRQAALNPLDAYFIASQHYLDSHAQAAAKLIFSPLALGPLQWKYTTRMENAPAKVYHRLINYLYSCRRAVGLVLKEAKDNWPISAPRDTLQRNKIDILASVPRTEGSGSGHENAGVAEHMPAQRWFGDYLDLVSFDPGLARHRDGGDWTSFVGPLALFQEASAESARALCGGAAFIIEEILHVGGALPQRLAFAVEEVSYLSMRDQLMY